MSARLSFRIAAGIFVLFALGHTFGFLSFRPPTPAGIAVWNSMRDVHFVVDGNSFSYGGFYLGFGLTISLSTLFEAFVCWIASGIISAAPKAARNLAWALCALQVGGLVLSLLYFSVGPAVFCGALVLLLAWAALQAGRTQKKGEPEGSPSMAGGSGRA